MLEVRENEIALRKLCGGTAQLRSLEREHRFQRWTPVLPVILQRDRKDDVKRTLEINFIVVETLQGPLVDVGAVEV